MKCPVCGTQMQSWFCPGCFADGFNEADHEIRQDNPHIYWDATAEAQNTWTNSQRGFWEDVRRAGFREPEKQPWPRPKITWMFDKQCWRVADPVTEGWVDVPLEAVEARMGRHITIPDKVTHRTEIEECAKRLLILLIYGCPPKLEAKTASTKKTEEAFRTTASEYFKIPLDNFFKYDYKPGYRSIFYGTI